MKKDKKLCQEWQEQEWAAREVLANAEASGKPPERLLASELDILLKCHEISKASSVRVDAKRRKWIEILNSHQSPSSYDPWTVSNEVHLQELEECNISMENTALGRLKELHKQEMRATFLSMNQEGKNEFIASLQATQEPSENSLQT